MALLARLPLNRICASQLCVSVTGLMLKVPTVRRVPNRPFQPDHHQTNPAAPIFRVEKRVNAQWLVGQRSKKKKKRGKWRDEEDREILWDLHFSAMALGAILLRLFCLRRLSKIRQRFLLRPVSGSRSTADGVVFSALIRIGPKAKSRGLRTDGNKTMNTCC